MSELDKQEGCLNVEFQSVMLELPKSLLLKIGVVLYSGQMMSKLQSVQMCTRGADGSVSEKKKTEY